MTKRVDSDALGPLLKSFGLAGKGAEETILQDAVLDQVIDVAPIVRRGRTLAATGGLYRGLIRNIHPGGGFISSAVSPYAAGVDFVQSPFPSPVPEQFDVWLLGATMQRFTGAGLLNSAEIGLNNILQSFGRDNLGAPVLSINAVMVVGFWNSLVTTVNTYGVEDNQHPWKDLRIRIPRHGVFPSSPVEITWRTHAVAAATFDLLLLIGLFPVSLGQDGIG